MGDEFKVGDRVSVRNGHNQLVSVDTVRLVNRHHVLLTTSKTRYQLGGCETGDGWFPGRIRHWTPDDDCERRMNLAFDKVAAAAIRIRDRKFAITDGNAERLESAAAALEGLVPNA